MHSIPQITNYIISQRQAGVSDDQIRKSLHNFGWHNSDIEESFETANQPEERPTPEYKNPTLFNNPFDFFKKKGRQILNRIIRNKTWIIISIVMLLVLTVLEIIILSNLYQQAPK